MLPDDDRSLNNNPRHTERYATDIENNARHTQPKDDTGLKNKPRHMQPKDDTGLENKPRHMQPSDNTDLKKQLLAYLSYWHLFAISGVLALALAYVFNRFSEPVYQARASILIEEDRTSGTFLRGTNMFYNRNNWFNETAILKSHTMVGQVLENMHAHVSYYSTYAIANYVTRSEIYLDSPFRVYFNKKHPQIYNEMFCITIHDENQYDIHEKKGHEDFKYKQRVQFGQQIKGEHYDFVVEMVVPYDPEEHDGNTYAFVMHRHDRLVSKYLSGLRVDFMGEGYSIVDVFFTATNAQRALDFVSMLSETYIRQNLEEKNRKAENTIRFIDQQLTETTINLDEAESTLQAFREDRQLIDISLMAGNLVNELLLLDKQRSIEEVKQQYYDFLLDYLHDDLAFSEVFGPSALGIDDPLLNNLLIGLSNQYAERSRLLLTATELSPGIQALDREIMQARATLAENVRSMQAASGITMHDLNRRIRQTEQRIGELPGTERELIGIQRRYNLSDATYNFLLEKRASAGIALATNTPDHKVVDAARPAGRVSPQTNKNYLLALSLGLGLPFCLLMLIDFFNTRVAGKEDVEKALGLPIVGLFPRHRMNGSKKAYSPAIYAQPASIILESFRSMRSNLRFFLTQSKNNIVVVTSTRAHEGKTFTSLNLAGALAMANRKTVLIDADLRKASTAGRDKARSGCGLSDYLIGQAEPQDILRQSRENENLCYIHTGAIPPNPAELLETEAMSNLLDFLREFQYIVIDTPPVGMVSDAQALLGKASLCVFVVRHRLTRHADLDFIRNTSEKIRDKPMAIAINAINPRNRRYGYPCGYGYGYGYGGVAGTRSTK